MRNLARGLALFAACAFVVACDKGPAEQALKAADAALDAAKPEIEKYVPSELNALTTAAFNAKAQFDKGDYKAALASAQELTTAVKAALEAAAKKKDELMAAFASLKGSLPGMVDGVKARLTQLESMKKLPKGMDKAAITSAKTDLGSATSGWAAAITNFDKGDVVQALDQANKAKATIEGLTKALMPPAAK